MNGIAQGLQIVGKGLLRYQTIADNGRIAQIEMWAYPIPGLPVRLMSPQIAAADSRGDDRITQFIVRAADSVLHFANGKRVTVPYNASNRLPVLFIASDIQESSKSLEASMNAMIADETNQNLSVPQQLLLDWHHKLNHIGYSHI